MSEPVNDDLLSEHADIDASLAAARREHVGRLAAVLDLDAGLAAILALHEDVGRAGLAGASDSGVSASSRPVPPLPDGQAAVIAVIRVRVLVLALARDLDRASDLYCDLGRARHRDLDSARDRARAHGFIHDLIRDRDLAHAHGYARDLADDLDRARDLIRDHDLDRVGGLVADPGDRVRDRNLALALANDLDRARAYAREVGLARDLDRAYDLARDLGNLIQSALDRANELDDRLHRAEVDASGADLSALNLADISVLQGVVWTEETTWPVGVREQVRLRSREIRPGVYQVGGGGEREPSELATT